MLKGIIFDMDDTITMTEPLHYKAFLAVFKEYGIDYTFEEQAEKYAGTGGRNIFHKVFEDRGIPITVEDIEKCIVKKRSLYTKIVQEEEIPLVPGVKEFIQRIHQAGLKKIIATGNSILDPVRIILQRVSLLDYFPKIVSSSEVPRAKPFPDLFLEATKRIGLRAEDCLILEDSLNGVRAASSAVIRCIALETTSKREELLSAGASQVVKDYYELNDQMLYGETI